MRHSFRNSCIPRHNIQRKMRKSYPWRKDAFQTETLQYIHFHLLSSTNCWLRAHVVQTTSLENPTKKLLWGLGISDFKRAWWTEASHTILEEKLLSEVKLTERKAALLKQNNKEEKEMLPFVTQYQPLVSIIKEASLMKKWNLIQNQPLPWQNFKEPRKGLYLGESKIMAKDMLVRAKT